MNPQTQMPVPTPTTKTTVEIWVSFLIEGTDVNALSFCKQAVAGTEEIVEAFGDLLDGQKNRATISARRHRMAFVGGVTVAGSRWCVRQPLPNAPVRPGGPGGGQELLPRP